MNKVICKSIIAAFKLRVNAPTFIRYLGHLTFRLIAICILINIEPCNGSIHVFGDSHTSMFKGYPDTTIHHLGPITMHRVGRDNIKLLNFYNYGVQSNDTVIMVFGEIDVRCHVKKIAKVSNRTSREVINQLSDNYLMGLKKIHDCSPINQVIICGVVPPIDTNQLKKYINPPTKMTSNFPIIGTLSERLSYNLKLNQLLEKKCSDYGLHFLKIAHVIQDKNKILNLAYSDKSIHVGKEYYYLIHNVLTKFLAKQNIPK